MKNFWRKVDWTTNKVWLLALSVIMVITILGVGVSAVGDPVAMGTSYTAGKLPVIGADGISLEDGPGYDSGTNTVDASSTGLTIATDAGVGKVLTSDGSGVGAWAAAPAGSVPNSGATAGVLLTGDGADGWNVGNLGASIIVAASDATAAEKAAAIASGGAVCDGTADDVEIQAAIDSLPLTATWSGGTINLSSGLFSISNPITPVRDLAIKGQGQDTTILKLADGADCNIFEDIDSYATWKHNFTLRDLQLDGNRDNNVSGSGVYLAPTGAATYWDIEISNCDIFRFSEYGIYTKDCNDVCVSYCPIELNDGTAVKLENGVTHEVHHCTLTSNGNYGLDLAGSTNAKVFSNQFSGNLGASALYGSSGVTIFSNYIFNAGANAINLSGYTNCMIANNRLNAATHAIVSYTGIGCVVEGNVVTSGIIRFDVLSGNIINNNVGFIAKGEVRTSTVSYVAANVDAIAASWHNPELQDIWIQSIKVLDGNDATLAATASIGIADDDAGTNIGTEFFTAIPLDAATGTLWDSYTVGDTGAQTTWIGLQDSASATDGWIDMLIAAANSDGTGTIYITYCGQ